jgi:hypothetical protein
LLADVDVAVVVAAATRANALERRVVVVLETTTRVRIWNALLNEAVAAKTIEAVVIERRLRMSRVCRPVKGCSALTMGFLVGCFEIQ